MGNTQMS